MVEKLQTKDLINVGIFTAVYFVIFFVTGMLGYIPILFVLIPVYIPITTGIPFMLFMTKVNKFGMITIMGGLLGTLMFLTGHTWIPVITGLIFGFLSDLIMSKGKYRSFRYISVGFGLFSLWSMGAMLPIWIMRESYFEYIRQSMGEAYTQAIFDLTPPWLLWVIFITTFVFGLVGAKFGRKVLKKHFKRAGIA